VAKAVNEAGREEMKIRVLLLLFLATSPVVCHGEEIKSVNMDLLEKFSSDLNDFNSSEKFEKYGNLKLKLRHTDVFAIFMNVMMTLLMTILIVHTV
jgi:hypothetical protein